MRPRTRTLTLVVLALWTVIGPVGMAFDGCAAMGGMCEGPCAPTTVSLVPLVPTASLPMVAMIAGSGRDRVPMIAPAVPHLPPKSPHAA